MTHSMCFVLFIAIRSCEMIAFEYSRLHASQRQNLTKADLSVDYLVILICIDEKEC